MTAKTTPDSSRAVVAQTQSPFLPGPGHHYPCLIGYSPSAAQPHTATPSVCAPLGCRLLWCLQSFFSLPHRSALQPRGCPLGCLHKQLWLMCMLYPAPPFRDPGQGNEGNEAWFPCVSDGDAGHTHHSRSREKGPEVCGEHQEGPPPPGLTQTPCWEGPVSLQYHCCSGTCGHRLWPPG